MKHFKLGVVASRQPSAGCHIHDQERFLVFELAQGHVVPLSVLDREVKDGRLFGWIERHE